MDVRLVYGPWIRQPLRIVLDPQLSCAPSSKIFQGGALVFAAADSPRRPDESLEVERVPRAGRGLDLRAIVQRLTAREVNELWVECGPRLAAAFLEADLVDELILYVAPTLLGTDAAPLTELKGIGPASVPPTFEFQDVQRIDTDLRLILRPKKA
jgi:diaminohydroxyphosphoribosylaminopyrimidine deaminase/5-amino-6-(5-phosphoribosylamino)uracil reductase